MVGDPKLLTEAGWKAAARDAKVRDKDLRRALLEYQGLDEEEHELRLEALAKLAAHAGALRKAVAELPELAAYLARLIAAAQAERREIQKAKADADKLAAKAAVLEDDEGEDDEAGEDEEDGTEDYPLQLTKALDKLKAATKPFHFLVCLARPFCVVGISPTRITGKRRARLAQVAGGNHRFLKPGSCRREGGELFFDMNDPPPGLARELLRSIKHFTGKKLKVTAGGESAEDEGGAQVAAGGAGRRAGVSAALPLEKTPEVWNATRRAVRTRLDQLKTAVRKAFAGEGAGVAAGIEKSIQELDRVFQRLDDDLSERLERAAASSGAARSAELQGAKALLAKHVEFVKSAPILTHIDKNPFDVATDLQGTLTRSLRHLVHAVGDDGAA